ncbi:hypothetical protein HELRODRAFT_125554, partial [Helobdella robusta]|uniref:TIAM1 CC-Ex domain-containing protein n=1 Tax=Helobdella robusta TaxID=6412 RepID=T1EH65_HELRO
CPEEMQGWIANIHSACISSMARQMNRSNVCKLLKAEIHKLENSIDLDLKMRKMASMQSNLVKEPEMRLVLEKQMLEWENNLDRLYMEQFQLRCYLAALQDQPLPSAKSLLSNISKLARTSLVSLGVSSPCSFHATICSRLPLTLS